MKRLLIVVALLAGLTVRAQETYTFAQRDTCELKLDIYVADYIHVVFPFVLFFPFL